MYFHETKSNRVKRRQSAESVPCQGFDSPAPAAVRSRTDQGVDISAREKILKMLIEINRTRNTTIVFASSELDELKRVCDRIAVMVQGRIFKILPPDAPEIDFGLALSGEAGVNDGL